MYLDRVDARSVHEFAVLISATLHQGNTARNLECCSDDESLTPRFGFVFSSSASGGPSLQSPALSNGEIPLNAFTNGTRSHTIIISENLGIARN